MRIRNWKEYNTALVNRGSVTIWFAEEVRHDWLVPERTGARGASPRYSDLAIACVLTLGLVYQLPLRQQQGFVQSVMRLLGVDLPVPNYTTLCRRRQSLPVAVPASCSLRRAEGVHVVVDSTGLKIYGEGEWKVRLHGASKRRTWRKLHLAVDEASGEILAAELTVASAGDGERLPALLDQVEEGGVKIGQVSADGAYDSWDCHESVRRRGAKATIPPRSGSQIKQHGNSRKPLLSRDESLRRIRKVGEAVWKRESGYHRRSSVKFPWGTFAPCRDGDVSPEADIRGGVEFKAVGEPAGGGIPAVCRAKQHDPTGDARQLPGEQTVVQKGGEMTTKAGIIPYVLFMQQSQRNPKGMDRSR